MNEVASWLHVSVQSIQDICNKRLGMPLRCAAKKPLLLEKIVRKKGWLSVSTGLGMKRTERTSCSVTNTPSGWWTPAPRRLGGRLCLASTSMWWQMLSNPPVSRCGDASLQGRAGAPCSVFPLDDNEQLHVHECAGGEAVPLGDHP